MRWLPPLDPAGATAVVTGAAGGMGEHLARGLARRGASVVIADVRREALHAVRDTIRDESPSVAVHDYVVDLSDATAAAGSVRSRRFGGLPQGPTRHRPPSGAGLTPRPG